MISLGAVLAPSVGWGQDAPQKPQSPQGSRIDAMRRLANSATLAEFEDGKAGPSLALQAEPLLHYGDPARGIREGTLWAWGRARGGRAAALMKVEYWPGAEGEAGHWGLAVGALAPRPVSVEFPDRLHWTSRKPGLAMTALPDAPAPADTPAQRLTQAKTLARRFAVQVDTHRKAGTLQLRLLPKPVSRYDDPDAGLVDGVFFALVHATNPITLLALEVRTGDRRASAWSYGFARFGDGEATAKLDGKAVWTVPFIDSAQADSELYMTRPMPEGAENRE